MQTVDRVKRITIGVDEAGRGPLAGPVVAAAVLLKGNTLESKIADSKKLSARQRERAFTELQSKAYVGLGIIDALVIDEMNILRATFFAMTRAVEQLVERIPADENIALNPGQICVMVDGNRFQSDLPYTVRTVIKGDASVLEIACASIVAKVTRDRILQIYDKVLPGYGYAQHKGYPTPKHKQAIRNLGPSFIQRHSFSY